MFVNKLYVSKHTGSTTIILKNTINLIMRHLNAIKLRSCLYKVVCRKSSNHGSNFVVMQRGNDQKDVTVLANSTLSMPHFLPYTILSWVSRTSHGPLVLYVNSEQRSTCQP